MVEQLKTIQNMGNIDKVVRFLFGSVCVYTGIVAQHWLNDPVLNLLVAVFGAMNVTSSLLGVCPAYLLGNLSTIKIANPSVSLSKCKANSSYTNTELSNSNVSAVRRKLLLSVFIPMIGMLLLFGHNAYRTSGILELQKNTASSNAAARLALQLDEIYEQSAEDASPKEISLIANALAETEMLAFFSLDGTQRNSGYEIDSSITGMSSAVREAIIGMKFFGSETTHGIFAVEEKEFIWSAIPTGETDILLMSVIPLPKGHNALGTVLTPTLLVIMLGTIWLALWSSSYIVNKFIENMSENAKDIEYRSTHDAQTNLPNRMMFEELMENRIQQVDSQKGCVACMIVDIAGFRNVNDTLGYKMGDKLIQRIATGLVELTENRADVIRIGGDVFAVLCPTGPDRSEASLLANQIHDDLEQHDDLDGVPLTINAHIGVAFFPMDSSDASELSRLADIALAHAKSGHHKIFHYQYEKDNHSIRKLSLLARLRGAIENNELSLVYQPKVDIQNGTIVGVEALVRWVDEEYGHVSPIEFVTWAEKSGLIDKLTHSVLNNALVQYRDWQSRGIKIPIAVNLSPLNLHDPTLPKLISGLMEKGGFEKGMLELELTENAVMDDPAKALATMTLLHGLGIKFAIDDFGTGLSSFTYLRKFPVSHLKIDRTFVMDPDSDDRDAVLLKSMINLGHSLECVVTAEGVEDRQTLDSLIKYNCDYVQGYHVCKPMTGDDFITWYNQSDWASVKNAA